MPERQPERTANTHHTSQPSPFDSSGFPVQLSKSLFIKTLRLPKLSTRYAAPPDTITQTGKAQQ